MIRDDTKPGANAARPGLRGRRPGHYCSRCRRVLCEDSRDCPHCQTDRPELGWPGLDQCRDPWLGTLLNERYRVLQPVGSGSCSEVYLVESTSISRTFALKIIATDRDDSCAEAILARLDREISALSRLRNPHIVSCYETLDLGHGYVGVVMDYVEGVTLEELVEKGAPLGIERACSILRQTANGLYEAHRAGMIHRDLKPENLMVERLPAGDDFTHILDFGVVQLSDESSVRLTHGFVGTPLYASPEQILDRRVDHRSDIYGLGGILFFMLTGRPPFASKNTYDVLRMHIEDSPPSLGRVMAQRRFPQTLEDLVATMLAKEPDQRPQELSEVIARLDRLIHQQNSEACVDPASTQNGSNSSSSFASGGSPATTEQKVQALSRVSRNRRSDQRSHCETPQSGIIKIPAGLRRSETGTEDETSRRREKTPRCQILALPSRQRRRTSRGCQGPEDRD